MKAQVRAAGRSVTVEDLGASVALVAATTSDAIGNRGCVALVLSPAQAHALASALTAAATLAEEHVTAGERMAEGMAALGLLRVAR